MADKSQVEETNAPNFSSLYFGYASNLSPRTMKQRCPDCLFAGMARLEDYKWIINQTGYATVVPSPGDFVYGGLFFLSGRDESALDHSEGVPWLNEKHTVPVTRMDGGDKVQAVTYVDVQRKEESEIERDYVVLIQKAMNDGLQAGIPASYFEKYFKPFVPESHSQEQDITLVRTYMTPNAGERLDHSLIDSGNTLTSGWMKGVGGGRMRDGSTA